MEQKRTKFSKNKRNKQVRPEPRLDDLLPYGDDADLIMSEGELERFNRQVNNIMAASSLSNTVTTARQNAGAHLTILLDDLEAWLSDLTKKVDEKVLANLPDTGDWSLEIYSKAFLSRPDIKALSLATVDVTKWPTVLWFADQPSETLRVFAKKEQLPSLLPPSPVVSKRLQLFGLAFRISNQRVKVPPYQPNLVLSMLNLVTFGPAGLPQIKDHGICSLETESYVHFLHSAVFPISEQLLSNVRAAKYTKRTKKSAWKEAQFLYDQALYEQSYRINIETTPGPPGT